MISGRERSKRRLTNVANSDYRLLDVGMKLLFASEEEMI